MEKTSIRSSEVSIDSVGAPSEAWTQPGEVSWCPSCTLSASKVATYAAVVEGSMTASGGVMSGCPFANGIACAMGVDAEDDEPGTIGIERTETGT